MLTNWSITKTRLSQFRDLRAEEKNGKNPASPKKICRFILSHWKRIEVMVMLKLYVS
jgi:hypothetical protein